ncbi:MAG: hypothetical protein WCP98_11755, partial [Actinomycetes bacterium]
MSSSSQADGGSARDGVTTPAKPRRVERWVPGARVLRTYEKQWLRADLVAGVVLAAILVPQGMA